MTQAVKIMFIAGEASGDTHAAQVVKALKALDSGIDCFGIGSRNMQAAGCRILFDSKAIAVMGLFEVLRHFSAIKQAWKIALDALDTEKPDCVILVDYPGFNLRFAKEAKARGIKVLYYVSPQIWAWKKNRIHKIKRCVDHMAVILPFEEAIYQAAGVPVTFVGSPLLDEIEVPEKAAARAALNLSRNALIIGLLPGSRKSEISRLLPPLMGAAEILRRRYPQVQFVLPLADTLKEADIRPGLENMSIQPILVRHNSHLVMKAADVLMGSSGTATLEAAVIGTPMVVIYKMNSLTFAIAKRVVKIPFISLPNILAQKKIFPELIQKQVTAVKLAEAVQQLLDNEACGGEVEAGLQALRVLLGQSGAAKKVAEIALALCDNKAIRKEQR